MHLTKGANKLWLKLYRKADFFFAAPITIDLVIS